jgi:hypothetical protein
MLVVRRLDTGFGRPGATLAGATRVTDVPNQMLEHLSPTLRSLGR